MIDQAKKYANDHDTSLSKLNVTMQTSAQWVMPYPTMYRSARIVGEDVACREWYRMNSVLKAGGRVALGLEDKNGSLEVRKLADIVVLEKDLYKVVPPEISTTRVRMTMMNGKITHNEL